MADRNIVVRHKRGFALITVLWMLAAGSVILLHSTQEGRDTFNSARNRTQLSRAQWTANACLEIIRALADQEMSRRDSLTAVRQRWIALDERLENQIDSMRRLAQWPGCDVTFEAAGARADLNEASPEALSIVFQRTLGEARPDLVAAIEDWRDSDDSPEVAGAEREWYQAHHRMIPRNAAIEDIHELARIRGFEDSTFRKPLTQVLGVYEGKTSLNNAPTEVIQGVPGMSREAAQLIIAKRTNGEPISSLNELLGGLSTAATDTLLSHFSEATSLVTYEPVAWTATIQASSGASHVGTVLEARLARSVTRAALVRRRSWP